MSAHRLLFSLCLASITTVVTGAEGPVAQPGADAAAPAHLNEVTPVRPGSPRGVEVVPAIPDDRRFIFSTGLAVGYDTNIVQLPDELPDVGHHDGSAVIADAKLTWRAVERSDRRLKVIAATELDEYPGSSEDRLIRYGGVVSGMVRWHGVDPGLAVGLNRFVLDTNNVATVASVNATVALIGARSAHIPGFDLLLLNYDRLPDASGTLALATYRYWRLLDAHDTKRRIELSLRAGRFSAQTELESYTTVRPSVAMLYRIGTGQRTGTWDLGATFGLEQRVYDEGDLALEAEHQFYWNLGGSATRWLNRDTSLEVYSRYLDRHSNIDLRSYDRFQIGLHVNKTW